MKDRKRIQRIRVLVFRCTGICKKEWKARVYGDVRQKENETEEQLRMRAEAALIEAVQARMKLCDGSKCDLCQGRVKYCAK